MSQIEICSAINSRRVIRFYYSPGDAPGYRTVEPYMVAFNQDGQLALSAWFLSGASKSMNGPGWREYLLSGISRVTDGTQQFDGLRPGYQRGGGKLFHDIQCAL